VLDGQNTVFKIVGWHGHSYPKILLVTSLVKR
jgi:hypothetical protein